MLFRSQATTGPLAPKEAALPVTQTPTPPPQPVQPVAQPDPRAVAYKNCLDEKRYVERLEARESYHGDDNIVRNRLRLPPKVECDTYSKLAEFDKMWQESKYKGQ